MLSVEGDYNDLSEDTGYKLSGAFSDTLPTAVSVSWLTATYQDVEVRSDAVHEFFVTPDTPFEIDADEEHRLSIPRPSCSGCAAPASARASSRRSGRA